MSKDPQGEIDLKDESLNIRRGTCEDGCWSKIPLERTIVVETTNRKYYLFSETVIEAVSWLGMLRDVTSKQNCQTHVYSCQLYHQMDLCLLICYNNI